MSSFLGSSGPEWQVVEQVPVEDTLFDVAHTADGPYAVGESGTLIADRASDDGGWEVIVDAGPATKNNKLTAVSVTTDGKRIWFLGSSGSLGCFDVTTGKKYDYSFPKGMTSPWQALTVGGKAGSEIALAANGSGEVLPFALDGFEVDWGKVSKPMAGASITALGSNDETAYAVDTSGNAYKTTPNDGWVKVGIPNAQVALHDLYVGANQTVYVAADDGRIYRYDDSAKDWTPIDVAKAALHAVDLYEDQLVVLGGDGIIYQRTTGGDRWSKTRSPVETTLYGLALGHPDLAVGKSGTVLVRKRRGSADESKSSGTSDAAKESSAGSGDQDSGGSPDKPTGKQSGGSSEKRRSGGSSEKEQSKQQQSGSDSGAGSPPSGGSSSQPPEERSQSGGETTDVLQFPEVDGAAETETPSGGSADGTAEESAEEPVLSFPEVEAESEPNADPFEYLAERDVVLVLTRGC